MPLPEVRPIPPAQRRRREQPRQAHRAWREACIDLQAHGEAACPFRRQAPPGWLGAGSPESLIHCVLTEDLQQLIEQQARESGQPINESKKRSGAGKTKRHHEKMPLTKARP
jgi:hypothetical protein